VNADDVLATIAALPRSKRPTELRSDSAMLKAWLKLRACRQFRSDVIERHNLQGQTALDLTNPAHEHAYGNAIGHCVQVIVLPDGKQQQ
jgi:hypothetical protein